MTRSPLSSAAHADAMREYAIERQQAATRLAARGPLKLDTDGRLAQEILRAYRTHGFYVFENVVAPAEIGELRNAVNNVIDRAPARPKSELDMQGRPAIGRDHAIEPFVLASHCRIRGAAPRCLPAAIRRRWEPTAASDAPEYIVHLIFGMCMLMPEALRLYGHPGLLAVAASINGDDFVPYNDAIFVKKPGLGASVGWHQDGATHWDSPAWHADIHGFNFQVQLHATTAANALWVVPGSHHHGKADIKAMVAANGGSDMLPDAVPLVCGAGDVTIANRQIVHGSFANSSPDPQCRSPSGSTSEPPCSGSPASSGWPRLTPPIPSTTRSESGREQQSSRLPSMPALGTCRTRHPSSILPFANLADDYRYEGETIDRVVTNYNLHDLAI